MRLSARTPFWVRVNHYAKATEDGCWIWTGSRSKAGYGQACIGGKVVYARRWVYEAMGGHVPAGKQLSATCGRRACVCPFHAVPLTRSEIAQRAFGAPEGKRTRQPNGYINVKRNGKWLSEHRTVMEHKLSRRLRPGETVHHINGNRADNRPENLQLLRVGQPKGQAHRCLDCGSDNIAAIPLEV